MLNPLQLLIWLWVPAHHVPSTIQLCLILSLVSMAGNPRAMFLSFILILPTLDPVH